MKKPLIIYPFLFALYPILSLYAQLPGGLLPITLIRPSVIAILLTSILWAVFHRVLGNWQRGAFISFLCVLFFSTSGHIYRALINSYFPEASSNLHLIIVMVELIVLGMLISPRIWQTVLKPERIATLTNYLNLVALIVLIWPLVQIGRAWYSMLDDTPQPWSDLIRESDFHTHLTYAGQPDIYYIILDGYGRQDVLRDIFNFDNSEFTGFLTQRGFIVAGESQSNYVQSILSISSSLNMNYVDFAEQLAGPYSSNVLPLYQLTQNSRVMNRLRDAGYSIVAFSSDFPWTEWHNADHYLSPYSANISELERFLLSTTILGLPYDLHWGAENSWLKALPLPSYETRQTRAKFTFEGLLNVAAFDSPKFVFAHVIVPHPPFIFDAQGNALVPTAIYSSADGEGFQGSPEEYQQAYIEQVQFVNRELIKAIDSILAKSEQPPIIIIQGDHGPGSLLQRNDVDRSCLWERASILNAYYFPDSEQVIYSDITPVNSFRVLFNSYFGTEFPMLADKTFFSPLSWPYAFTEITDRIGTTCEIPE